MSQCIYLFFKDYRDSIIISYEDLHDKDKDWYAKYQFIVVTSVVSKKIEIVNQLKIFDAHFFSLLHNYSTIGPDTKIGQGTLIFAFNSIDINDIVIGDHVIICTHNTLGHNCVVEDYCHIGHHSFLNWCNLGKGTVLGTRIEIMSNRINERINIPEYCNIISHSLINESILESGTYYKSRKTSDQTSLTLRIL
jgi:carbonic anhydrase/acetyltransferase-like protein (isoleucine patch superfamily)